MNVTVTLKFPGKIRTGYTAQMSVPWGSTTGDFKTEIVRNYERTEKVKFSGANFVTLLNGRIASGDELLCDGDEIEIIAVAAGG